MLGWGHQCLPSCTLSLLFFKQWNVAIYQITIFPFMTVLQPFKKHSVLLLKTKRQFWKAQFYSLYYGSKSKVIKWGRHQATGMKFSESLVQMQRTTNKKTLITFRFTVTGVYKILACWESNLSFSNKYFLETVRTNPSQIYYHSHCTRKIQI